MAQGKKAPDTGNYQVVARRFRPKSFDELVGQEPILQSLETALSSGRVPHAFLFSGSRGVGKTTLARILARCLNCEKGVSSTPCGECASCCTTLAGTNPDIYEVDAASHNGVDDIRELRERVGVVSMASRYKVYILDEVHMLSKAAFNAFLKTLEEPPPGVVFILATTELHKIPDTIRSRCQVLLFQRVGEEAIQERLRRIAEDEGLKIPDEVFQAIAQGAAGGMRDSETTLERILPVAQEMGSAFGIDDYRRLVHKADLTTICGVVGSLLEGSAKESLYFVEDLVNSGVDEREALGEILQILRAILLLKIDGPDTGLVSYSGDLRTQLQSLAESVETTRLDAMVQAGLLGRERIRRVDDRRLVLEISLLRMAEAGRLPQLSELLEQVRSGALASPPPATGPAGPPGEPRATGASAAASGASASVSGSLQARLLAHCAQNRGLLLRTLEMCSIQDVDQNGLVAVELQTDRKLHRDRLDSDGVQRQLRQMLEAVHGAPVELAITFGRAVGAAPEPLSASKVSSQVEPGSGVRKVLERFSGKIVNVEREADS
jgi:DNA polymerase-3 subunit gamma/tau